MISQLSLDAYHSLDPDTLSRRESQVWLMLRVIGPATSRELADALGWRDCMVTGRINRLEADGWVRTVGERANPGGRLAALREAVR